MGTNLALVYKARGIIMFEKHTLPNGLRIVAEPMESVRSVTVGIWIKSGSRFENLSQQGISHLLEHMLFKGTDSRTAQDIAEEIDSIGGHINAFTSKEYTCIYIKVIDSHFETALAILADMFFNSKFDQEDLEKEKQVIFEELKMYEDTPDEYVHDLLIQSCYGEHELAHNILGDRESVSNLSSEALINHHKRYFTPEKTVISVSGNVSMDNVVETATKYFGSFVNINNNDNHPLRGPSYYTDSIVKGKDTEQVHFCLAFPGLSVENSQLYHLGLLNNILGGSMSSKFFQEIREKRGLCYSVYSYYLNFTDSGLFVIYAGFSQDNFNETYDLIWSILDEIKQGSITDEELNRSKEQVKGNILMGLESTSNRMARLGRDELLKGEILTYEQIIEKIENITKEDLLKLAQDLFQKNQMSSAVIGPMSEEEVHSIV